MINNPPSITNIQAITQWFQQVFVICFSIQQSGNTVQRPQKTLWVGRRYFDTDLGKPIWLKSSNPTVWVDATGTTV